MDRMIDWALTRPMPWRILAVFSIVGGVAFGLALIALTLLIGWCAPMSVVLSASIGCGVGTGLGNALNTVLYLRLDR